MPHVNLLFLMTYWTFHVHCSESCSDNDGCLSSKFLWSTDTCESASQWCGHFLWSKDVDDCCPKSCGLCAGEPTQSPVELPDGALILPLAEIMDYLHFVVTIDIGDENNSVTYNPIVDTASGKLMMWNYEQLTSNDFNCGCYSSGRDDLGLCSVSTASEDECPNFEYCGWHDNNCYPSRSYIPFYVDNERVSWDINVFGAATMRFADDTSGTFKESNMILVSMHGTEQSDIPIHNFTDMKMYSDGIIGLSYNFSRHGSTFWDLCGTGIPDVFALDFNRDCGIENLCEIHINYINTDRYDVQYGDLKFEHEWAYGEQFHEFEMYDLLLCNTRLLGDFPTEVEKVLVDTGSSCLTLNTKAFAIMTQLLSSVITCLEVKEGRPKTCFVATENLDNLPPLRFRMKNDSSVWLNLRLDNLVFGDLSGSSKLEFPGGEYYELCIQEHDTETVFGTMVLTNFYSVFDLVTKQVGLANHDESNEYIDVDSGDTIQCNHGLEGWPNTLTACESDETLCPTAAPVSKELCFDNDECIRRKDFWESHTCETASQWCDHFLWSADVQECCPLVCDVCPESPTLSPIWPEGGLIIPLAQVMDYLHFVVSIEVGEGDDAIVVNSIVDTASGALMLWNHDGVTSSTIECGCYNSHQWMCTHGAQDKETCEEFDYCEWSALTCNAQNSVAITVDNEIISWDLDVSGEAVMRFLAASDVEPMESDFLLVSFQDYQQSDIPIHNFTQMLKYTDGIIGLSYSYRQLGQKTTFWDMYGRVPESFSLDFNRDCGVDNPCEMHIDYISDKYDVQFGDTDYERKYRYGLDVIFHEFEMYDLLLCNTRLFDVISTPDENVLVDTGSSCLVLRTELFAALTTLLGPILKCISVAKGRPQTCFVKQENLANLPPLRFRMHPDSNAWLIIRLENLLFGNMGGAFGWKLAEGYYELCIQEHSAHTSFGTMALTNFYAVFDLVNESVGLANHDESNEYLDFDTGEMVTCSYGELGEPGTLSLCEVDISFCSSNSSSSSSSNMDVFLILVILVVVLVVALMAFFCIVRWRKMRTELLAEEGIEPLAPEGVSSRLGDMACVQVNDDGVREIAFRQLVEQKRESEPSGEPAYPPRPAGEADEWEGTFAVANSDEQEGMETR